MPLLPDGKVAKQVVAGGCHTMILAEDGTVFACGSNGDGKLGLGDNIAGTPSPRCHSPRTARSDHPGLPHDGRAKGGTCLWPRV